MKPRLVFAYPRHLHNRELAGLHPSSCAPFLSGFTNQTAGTSLREAHLAGREGANQGLYSLIAAGNPRCQKILSFEPVEATFALLEGNINANAGATKTLAMKVAISNSDEILTINIKPHHSGAASLRHGEGMWESE